MGSGRKRAIRLSDRACIHCQRRKTRCVSDGQSKSCLHCIKAGKECIIEKPPPRTSLTRKNLEAAEARCTQLETLLRRLHPDLKLEDEISNPDEPNDSENSTTPQA